MTNLQLTLTGADYPRILPLAAKLMMPEGIDLTMILGRNGSWSDRSDMLQKALHDPAVQGGEASMMFHLARIDKDDRSYVPLPVFPLRVFTGRDLYIRRDSGITSIADLAGKRIGMYGWGQSASVWYRHFLLYMGLDLASVQWWIGPVDSPRARPVPVTLPAHVKPVSTGNSLSAMLIAGELDAIYSPPRPKDYDPVNGPIVRLFPNYRTIEQKYYRDTGIFPPHHVVLLRRAVWEENKWIARSLTDAFIACDKLFSESIRGFPYITPWQENELAETESAMGADFQEHGFEKNRAQIAIFCDQAFSSALIGRRITPEEYFADYLAS